MASATAVSAHAPLGAAMLDGPSHVFEVINNAYAAMVGNRPSQVFCLVGSSMG